MNLSEEEKKIIWVALNTLQDIGMNKLPMYQETLIQAQKHNQAAIVSICYDWIIQTKEEYDLCEALKKDIYE